MSGDAPAATVQTYLVEHYRPDSTAADLTMLASRVREAVDDLEREGRRLRFRHSIVVAADETLLCVVDAASEDLVRLAYDRASVIFDRISAAALNGRDGADPMKGVRTMQRASPWRHPLSRWARSC